jgi:hypothetical protein
LPATIVGDPGGASGSGLAKNQTLNWFALIFSFLETVMMACSPSGNKGSLTSPVLCAKFTKSKLVAPVSTTVPSFTVTT